MNNKQRKILTKAWHNLMIGMGAHVPEKYSKVNIFGLEFYTYGYDLMTKYGPLTAYLDVEDDSFNILTKYLNCDLLPDNIPNKVYNRVPINGITFNGYAGKWNLHLGKVSKDSDLAPYLETMQNMFRGLTDLPVKV